VLTSITAPGALQGTAWQAHAQHLPHDLPQMMRRFGRQWRGLGTVCVTLGRHTETPLLARGRQVLPLARAVQPRWPSMPQRSEDQRARLDTQLTAARAAHQRIAPQARRLTQGKVLAPGTIVHASEPTMAPIGQGKSHGPAPFGRKPGMSAEPAAGLIFARHLPVGNPRAARSVEPLVDHGEQAIARVRTRPTPAIHSRAGDLALPDVSWREAWHARGMRTVGIPTTVAPLPSAPTPEDVLQILDEADLPHRRTPSQVHLACACGDSRPVVESLMASRLHRGAARLTDTGHRGAIVQTGMAVMTHHAATLVRIHESRLSKRARMCRRRLRLRCRHVNQCHAAIN
jgi:hypothetical protein